MKKIFYIISGSLLLASCVSDVLDKKPIGRELSSNFYQNESNAITAANALYDAIQREEGYVRGFYPIAECRGDLSKVAGNSSSDQLAGQQIAKYIQLADNTYLIGIYKWSYVGIQRCNNLLENVTYSLKYSESNPAENKTKVGQLRGQAYFMRAFYYADLVRIFGPVQFLTQTVTADKLSNSNRTADDDNDGNKQVELIYKQIIQDLDSASALLPSKWAATDLGRATKGAAQAFLARAYMHVASNDKIFVGDKSQYWQKAADAADAVIASGDYKLLSDYHNVFKTENNEESLFEIQAIDGSDADFRAEGSIRSLDQMFRFIQYKGAVSGVLGYGLNSPTSTYVAMFDVENTDGTKGYSLDFTNKVAKKKKDWDARLDLIAKPEDSIYANYQGSSKWCNFYCDQWKWGIGEPFYGRKTELNPDNLGGKGGQSSGKNWIYYRYAELVLYRAEAALRLGDNATALKMINAVRDRARKSFVSTNGASPIEGKLPATLTSVSMDDIIKERALELGLEGTRFFDLVRTGYATKLLETNDIKESVSATVTLFTSFTRKYTEKDAVLPIPAAVIIEGQGLVKQNKGY